MPKCVKFGAASPAGWGVLELQLPICSSIGTAVVLVLQHAVLQLAKLPLAARTSRVPVQVQLAGAINSCNCTSPSCCHTAAPGQPATASSSHRRGCCVLLMHRQEIWISSLAWSRAAFLLRLQLRVAGRNSAQKTKVTAFAVARCCACVVNSALRSHAPSRDWRPLHAFAPPCGEEVTFLRRGRSKLLNIEG
jgi:hypothetical protein